MRYVLISYSNLVKYGVEDGEKKRRNVSDFANICFAMWCDATKHFINDAWDRDIWALCTTVSISILELELRWASVQLQICAKAIIAKQMNRKLSSEDYYNNFNLTGCKCRESIAHTVEVKTQCRNIQNGSEEGHRKWWHNVTANMLRI